MRRLFFETQKKNTPKNTKEPLRETKTQGKTPQGDEKVLLREIKTA